MKTSWKNLGDPRFLGEYNFDDGKDMILSLKEVRNEEIFEKHSNTKQIKRTGLFNETKLMMVLNKTNCDTLDKLFGTEKTNDYTKWYNRKIAIYFDPTVKFGKKEIGGVRVRSFLPKNNKPTFICEMCGVTIIDTEKYTAEQICKSTTIKFGKCLCLECGTKAKEKAELPTLEQQINNMEDINNE